MVEANFEQVFNQAASQLSPEAKSILEGKGTGGSSDSDVQRQVDETRKKLEESAAKIKKDQKGFLDKSKEGYHGGGSQAGTQVENDLNELKSGRFAGVFERAFASVKSMKDTFQEVFGQKKEQTKQIAEDLGKLSDPKDSELENLKEDLPIEKMNFGENLKIGAPKEREKFSMLKAIQEETRGKLDASRKETENYFNEKLFGDGDRALQTVRSGGSVLDIGGSKTTPQIDSPGFNRAVFEKAEFKKVEIKDGKGIGGLGGKGSGIGGSGGGENPSGSMGESAGKFGLIVGGIAAAGMKLMSSLAGMYQQALSQQDSTLDAMGYVGSGGALTSNAEMAQIGLRRAKLLGGEGKDQLNNKLGVQFGLRQGIGGSEGAEIFGKLNKYANFKEDKETFKEILAQGVKGGFEGLRQSEMFSRIAGMSENSYLSGYGKADVLDTASIVAALSTKGIGSDNSLSMAENLQKNFQEEGSLFQQLVIGKKMEEFEAAGMGSSEAYLNAKAYAQNAGNFKDNLSTVKSEFGKMGMDDSTMGVVLEQMGIGTANQLVDVKNKSGSYNVLDFGQEDYKASTSNFKDATKEFSKTVKVGQSFRATANAIDNLVVGSAVAQTAYMTQLKITSGMIDILGKGDSAIGGYINSYDKAGGGVEGMKAVGSDLVSDLSSQAMAQKLAKFFSGSSDKNNEKGKTDKEIAGSLKELTELQKTSIDIQGKTMGLNESQIKALKEKNKGAFR